MVTLAPTARLEGRVRRLKLAMRHEAKRNMRGAAVAVVAAVVVTVAAVALAVALWVAVWRKAQQRTLGRGRDLRCSLR